MSRAALAAIALVLSTVAAQAQAVRIGGEGRMGVLYESVRAGGLSESAWAQENRLQFNFAVTVTADHGLTLGAASRIRINNGATGVFSGSRVWVEASNLRLTFGNVDGALRGAGVSHGYAGGCGVGYVGGHYCGDTAGLTGLGTLGLALPLFSNTAAIQGAPTQGFASAGGGAPARARLDYGFGDTRVALSHDRDGATELGLRTRAGAFTLAAGYANRAILGVNVFSPDPSVTSTDLFNAQIPGSILALSGHYNGGTWGVGLLGVRVRYADFWSVLSHTNWSLSGTLELRGGRLYGYVGRVGHASTGFGLIHMNAAGISYGHVLGGGATLTGGIERLSGGNATYTSASLGVAFTF